MIDHVFDHAAGVDGVTKIRSGVAGIVSLLLVVESSPCCVKMLFVPSLFPAFNGSERCGQVVDGEDYDERVHIVRS